MPTYSYTAKNTKGESKKGSFEAESKVDVARELRREGFVPIKIEQIKRSGKAPEEKNSTPIEGMLTRLFKFDLSRIGLFEGASTSEKMMFSRHLAVMISAGVPITRALEVLSKQTKNASFKIAILGVAESIRKGKSVADSLAQYPKIFDDLYVSMIRSGDSAGNLSEVLELLSEQLRKDNELKSRVKGALMYPAVIVIAMGGIGILMMIMVVPKISEIFEDLDTELPPLTRLVIGTSNFIADYWLFVLLALPFLIYALKKIASTKEGKKFLSWLFLKIPLFRELTKKINSARFARTLSSLTSGGVPILEGLDITRSTLSNIYYRESIVKIRKDVRGGKTLFKSMEKFGDIYPGLIVQMVQVGEETGALSEVLVRVAEFYEDEVNNATKNLYY